ncbi:Acyl-ACP Synthetase [Klebsormidium nitens]|uniref:Acyl-ACP Synthetase n=1 Tax=Klebsormidium nitens TaxID=105231 RepID=A0A1Y1ISR1_KLENI|nr:Acyl-ACP Synthetase [Klebsormidium nitens]|eukprot:GAQ91218.1 Acyl-ACP Synthetase [Klebsormidium nitens]
MTSGVVCSGSSLLGQLAVKQTAPTLCAAQQSRTPGGFCPQPGASYRSLGSDLLCRHTWSSAAVLAGDAALLKQGATPAGHVQARGRRGRRPQVQCRQEVWGPAVTTSPPDEPARVVRAPSVVPPPPSSTVAPNWEVLPAMWHTLAQKYGDRVALDDPHRKPHIKMTYKELEQAIVDFSEGLRLYGIKAGDRVGLFSDNSHRWIIADQGIMMAGAVDAVRGAKAPAEELKYILEHSESTAVVVETPEVLAKLAPVLGELADRIKFAVVLWGEAATNGAATTPFPAHSFASFLQAGKTSRQATEAATGNGALRREVPCASQDVATIAYTSGTTGFPKGVMLTHDNLLHQVRNYRVVLDVQPGEVLLSLLPPWHMYERSAEYFCLASGARQVYSSVKTFKDDLVTHPPDHFVAVPLVFEVLYNGVQRKLAQAPAPRQKVAKLLIGASQKYMEALRAWRGLALDSVRSSAHPVLSFAQWVLAGVVAALLLPAHLLASRLVYGKVRAALGIKKTAISGGGSLPTHVDRFFEMIGIVLLNGYGLTETSPVLTVRRADRNVVDPKTGCALAPGVKGVVKARGPQVMKGYLKDPEATARVVDPEGWFDTGDLGWLAPASRSWAARNCRDVLVLEGRSKDTIVMSTGENVEPAPVEEVLLRSPLVAQVMLVGNDQRRLGALVVPAPDELAAHHPDAPPPTGQQLQDLIRKDLNHCLAQGSFHAHERIGPVAIIDEPFSVENGLLTPTMKMKRDVIATKYAAEIAALYQKA